MAVTKTTAIITVRSPFPSPAAKFTFLLRSSLPKTHFPKPKSPSHTLRAKPSSNSAIDDLGGIFDESFFFGLAENDGDEEYEEEEENESSVELFLRLLQSMGRKISKRAKKASRSVLPPAIPTQLVSFAVDGFMVLALLSIVKAFLQVVCTLGGTVFVSIVVLRVIWATASYFQTNGSNLNEQGSSYGSAQPVS